jgi:hypothetical protein
MVRMDVQQELAQLRSTVAALTQQVASLTSERSDTQPAAANGDAAPRSTRRGALRLLGAATVGATAALVVGQPAAADNGISLLGSNNSTSNWTRCDFVSSVAGGTAFMFQAGNSLSPATLGGKPAALGGVSTSSLSPTGVQAYSNQPTGVGLHARHANGGDALFAEANGFGWAVYAKSVESHAIAAFSQNGTALAANGGLYGAEFSGDRAAMKLTATTLSVGPPSAALNHLPGEFNVDLNGDLWYCSGGTPRRWHKLNQPSFHPVTPARVYDSRVNLPTPGTLSSGQDRLVSVADARNLTTGAITTPDVVPAGALAVSANVTVTSTTGKGFLSINPGFDTVIKASTINWFESGQTLANGVMLTLDTARRVSVICGGTANDTHFVIDITGYFL